MNENLKLCPFCGGGFGSEEHSSGCFISMLSEQLKGTEIYTPEQLYRAWERRYHIEVAPVERNEKTESKDKKEPKFRGIIVPEHVWVYGGYCEDPDTHEDCIVALTTDNDYMPVEVIDGTLSMYSGRKDIRGIKIYTGDIVKCSNGHVGDVVWEEHDCCFNVSDYYNSQSDYPTMAFTSEDNFEIVGNIFIKRGLIYDYLQDVL